MTTTADSGAGSLRQALASAIAAIGTDTIAFALLATDPGHVYYRNDGIAGQVTLANVAPTTQAAGRTARSSSPRSPARAG